MQLTDHERAMLQGEHGEVAREALEMQRAVGEFFGAERFVPVTNVHFAGDYEMIGDAGYRFYERVISSGARLAVPVTMNTRCVDFALAERLRQDPNFVRCEAELQKMHRDLGAIAVNTCINYQTVYQPHFGEHLAWGDTGTVAYANSVFGARSNFESGPAAIAAGFTGRTAAYGFHLDEQRLGTIHVIVTANLHDVADWGALAAAIGREVRDYWSVPVIEFVHPHHPCSDVLKHLSAGIASHGSCAMFQIVGCTPEAPTLEAAFGGRSPKRTIEIGEEDIAKVYASFVPQGSRAELVVFTAPQLSLFELKRAAELLDGRPVHAETTFILTTNYLNKAEAKRLGYLAALERAGALVAEGTCWYVMAAGKMRDAFGWSQVVTNSSKLANIIPGYRYNAVLRDTKTCIEAAVTGKILA